MILGFIIVMLVTGKTKIVPVTAGRLSTTVQVSMIVAILLWPDVERVWPGFRYVIRILWWSAAAMATFAMIVYTRNGSRLLNEYEQQQKKLKEPAKNEIHAAS